ncbi:LysM peptidoglycan-binding domain-containing protein [Rossellomorea oryzaecorticis]|uniref:LysM peptidoglycan-binding domain-containing protein n=1 Tax=Rossellomorea oryzaecorticis TaxID=1396505 RepID=A0ABU9KA55_9BACI
MKKGKFFKSAALALTISALSVSSAGAAGFHLIQKGDTLWSLSKKYGMTVDQLKEGNNLDSSLIYAGDKLQVKKVITVKKGDTLWNLAKKHTSTVGQLKHVNMLKSDTINIGQKLEIPTVVLVRPGDTMWGISKKYGLTVEELKRRNGLNSTLIFAGQVLMVNKTAADKAQGYDADKVVPGLTPHIGYYYTAEEPRRFILQSANDDDYFARIEVLDSNADIRTVKNHAQVELASLGEVTELRTDNSLPFYKGAEFLLHAHNSDTQKNIVLKKVDGVLLKFTIHYRNAEESEGIVPEMLKMLNTIEIK